MASELGAPAGRLGESLQALRAAGEARRGRAATELRALREREGALARLRARLCAANDPGSESVFDREDLAMVDAELEGLAAAAKALERELEEQRARDEARAVLLRGLCTTLERRSAVLDDETEVLEAHPALLSKLAAKQVDLENLVLGRLAEP